MDTSVAVDTSVSRQQEFEEYLARGNSVEDLLEQEFRERHVNYHRCSLARDQRERGGSVMLIGGQPVQTPDFWVAYRPSVVHWAECKSATDHVKWRTGEHAGEEFIFIARRQLTTYKKCSLTTGWPVDLYHYEAGLFRVAYNIFGLNSWVKLNDGYLKVVRRDGSLHRELGFCLPLDIFQTPFEVPCVQA